jgi:hypothetical protein
MPETTDYLTETGDLIVVADRPSEPAGFAAGLPGVGGAAPNRTSSFRRPGLGESVGPCPAELSSLPWPGCSRWFWWAA